MPIAVPGSYGFACVPRRPLVAGHHHRLPPAPAGSYGVLWAPKSSLGRDFSAFSRELVAVISVPAGYYEFPQKELPCVLENAGRRSGEKPALLRFDVITKRLKEMAEEQEAARRTRESIPEEASVVEAVELEVEPLPR